VLQNEQEEKRVYDQHVRDVEHRSFSPLGFSTSGGAWDHQPTWSAKE